MDFAAYIAVFVLGTIAFSSLVVAALGALGVRQVRKASGPIGRDGLPLGKPWRVCIRGVLLFGWPIGLSLILADYCNSLSPHLFGEFYGKLTAGRIALKLSVWTLSGLLMGFMMEKSQDSPR